MKKTINRYEFIESMKAYYDGNGFSDEGLYKLFDYLENYEQETGEELEFDVVALHSQYSEMTVEDFINDYLTDDEIEKLKDDLEVDDIKEITSYDLYDYLSLYSDYYYEYIIEVVDYNNIIVDTEATYRN